MWQDVHQNMAAIRQHTPPKAFNAGTNQKEHEWDPSEAEGKISLRLERKLCCTSTSS